MRPTALTECKVGGPGCVLCSSGIGHGARLLVYDPQAGDYAEEDGERCTARWASAGDDHLTGDICTRPTTREAADLLLCEHHFGRLLEWSILKYEEQDERRHAAELRRMRERDAEYLRSVDELAHAQYAAHAKYSLIYYLERQSDGIIKIGTTASPVSRFDALRGRYGPFRMLASHGGTFSQENGLHGEFGACLAEGREWFRPEPELLAHIIGIRERHEVYTGSRFPIVEVGELRAMLRAAAL